MTQPGILERGRLSLSEGCYLARLMDRTVTDDAAAYQRLRFDYFVQQRGWVDDCPEHPWHECDRFDSGSYHVGVFRDNALQAYLRVLPWESGTGFMLEHDFHCLLLTTAIPDVLRESSLEVSRLVLLPELAGEAAVQVTELLFKLLYHLSLGLHKEHLYIVVEAGWIRRFRRCFHLPFHPLGPIQTFPDGTRTVAAHAAITELEAALQEQAPDKLRWYQQA